MLWHQSFSPKMEVPLLRCSFSELDGFWESVSLIWLICDSKPVSPFRSLVFSSETYENISFTHHLNLQNRTDLGPEERG